MNNAIQTTEAMPRDAASFSVAYPSIVSITPPTGAHGTRAWQGQLQPFSNDESARHFLHAMEERRRVQIVDETIVASLSPAQHWADPLLIGMNQVCRVMIIEPPAPSHPRAYLLDPAYDAVFLRINDHPHPRMDQAILHDGRILMGLCVYSAAEFEYTNANRHTQFMDQVLLWIGRHLIWLRTRRLYRRSTGAELYVPLPGEPIGRMAFPDERWRGTWIGPRARSTTRAEHVAHIPCDEECWCGSGSPYGDCHRAKEIEELQRTAS